MLQEPPEGPPSYHIDYPTGAPVGLSGSPATLRSAPLPDTDRACGSWSADSESWSTSSPRGSSDTIVDDGVMGGRNRGKEAAGIVQPSRVAAEGEAGSGPISGLRGTRVKTRRGPPGACRASINQSAEKAPPRGLEICGRTGPRWGADWGRGPRERQPQARGGLRAYPRLNAQASKPQALCGLSSVRRRPRHVEFDGDCRA